MRFGFALLLLVATQSEVLPAQETSKEDAKVKAPLVVESDTDQVASGVRRKMLQLRHTGDKPIVAYVLRSVVRSDATELGKQINTVCTMGMTGLVPNSRLPWQPGETLQEEIGLPAIGAAQTSIDYVLYADDSSFGPDSCHESFKIQGLRMGLQVAKANLKKILSERGIQAVIDELNK